MTDTDIETEIEIEVEIEVKIVVETARDSLSLSLSFFPSLRFRPGSMVVFELWGWRIIGSGITRGKYLGVWEV